MLREAPLKALAADLRSGKLDLLAHTQATLARLQAVDPRLHAFLPEPGRESRVMRAAETLLQRWPEPGGRPPLFGVTLGVKDIYRVDGLPTRAGSGLPARLFDSAQADCVTRLQQAGALVPGKTVTTEFACFEAGATRNPHNPEHTPGGSSSGSAAAVAAGLCSLALGSQTIGSMMRPAAFCGVVGYKPGHGRIDAAGVVYVAPSLDHVGVFAQDVAGLRLAAAVLCRNWRDVTPTRRPRIGVLDGPLLDFLEDEGRIGYEAQLKRLQGSRHELRCFSLFGNFGRMESLHRALMAHEMAREHRLWFAEHEALYRAGTAELIRRGQQVDADVAQQARESQAATRRELHELMDAEGIDLWVSPPATGPAPAGLEYTGNPVMNLPWTHAGLPTLSLPAGQASNGLPLGLQVSARHGADECLLAWAEELAAVLAGSASS